MSGCYALGFEPWFFLRWRRWASSATVQEYLTSRDNIAKALVADMEKGRLIDRFYAESITEDEEFAQFFQSSFGSNQRYTDSVITEVHCIGRRSHWGFFG